MRSVGCVLGAAIAFGTVSVLARRAYEAGSTPVSLLGVRMLVAALLLTGLAMRGGSWRVHPGELAAGAAAGMAFAAAGLGEFEALARAPAPTVVVLVFVAPVWIALAAWAAGRGAPGWLPAFAIALILVGLALVVGVPGGRAADGAAVALALGASVMSAAFFVAMGRLSGRVTPWRAACMAAWAASITTLLLEPTGFGRELSHRATGSYGLAIGALTACGLALLASGPTSELGPLGFSRHRRRAALRSGAGLARPWRDARRDSAGGCGGRSARGERDFGAQRSRASCVRRH